jgi:2-polyprenyl-6-methoxyphenol hydroxylase-like FAD-dependent oxidoreductase
MVLSRVGRYGPDRVPVVGDRAAVVGGSVAGLCAARVLSDAFGSVVVLERDELPDEPVARDGAPQTGHPHALLEAGRATLEDLFPGFGDALLSEGGLLIDALSDVRWYDQGGFLADGRGRSPMYTASRPLIEQVIRRQVRSLGNVRVRDGCRVRGYLQGAGGDRVAGVAFRDEDGEQRRLEADLVVDATGRTSRTPAWLETHGYDPPPVDEVRVDVDYSTVRIDRPPGDRRLFFVPPSAPRARGAFLIPIEDGQWEVLMQGIHDGRTPSDPDGVLEFLEGLPVPELSRLVRSRPVTSEGVRRYPFPSSLRRRYGDLDRFPDGLVVTGDAVASFNPIYGQGMSVAALDALALHHALAAGGRDDLAARYFDRVERVVGTVWQLAVRSDFAFERTRGPEPVGTDLANRYLARLLGGAHADPVLREAITRVLILERPPSTLLAPTVLWRVLRPTGRGVSRRTSAGPAEQ